MFADSQTCEEIRRPTGCVASSGKEGKKTKTKKLQSTIQTDFLTGMFTSGNLHWYTDKAG